MNRFVPATIVLLLVAWIGPATSRSALAAGEETLRRSADLAMMVDSRWAGGAHGGYYPIRIRLTNSARPRALTVRFVDKGGNESRLPSVERRVSVGPNATVQFTLSVPLVSAGSIGELHVYDNGRLLEPFSQRVSVPDAERYAVDRPSLLVIHPAPASIDCSPFDLAIQTLAGGSSQAATASRWAGVGYVGGVRPNDFEVIAPAMLPESWIDYSAVDIVAIPLATLEKLPSAVQSALFHWTEAGGTLLVTEVREAGEKSTSLARFLDPDGRPTAARIWRPAQPDLVPRITMHTPRSATGSTVISGQQGPESPDGSDDAAPGVSMANKTTWTVRPETFSHTDLLAGRVFAFPDNPFPGAPIDWAWWLNSANWSSALNWTARLGTSSRQRHSGFYDFLIPGVGNVPIFAFVLLISVFTVIIGPVNYFVVLRRKQLYLLVVTIPAIAFVTSAALFGYAVIADGFSVQSRLRSFTLLDQGTKHAVAFNRLSLYAGLAPSAGLRFSPETAVFPIWQDDVCFTSGAVDWTDAQWLTTGWLHSRTRTQFETVSHRIEPGRVEFTPVGTDALEAANGLEWAIDQLIVKDESGRLFAGRGVPAGGTLKLHPATDDDLRALGAVLDDSPLKAPPGAEVDPSTFGDRSRRGWMYGFDSRALVGFSKSLLELGLQRLARPRREFSDGGLAARSYLATFRENPGIELGVPRTVAQAGVHVLLGNY